MVWLEFNKVGSLLQVVLLCIHLHTFDIRKSSVALPMGDLPAPPTRCQHGPLMNELPFRRSRKQWAYVTTRPTVFPTFNSMSAAGNDMSVV